MKRCSREERVRQVEDCEASGMAVSDWCAANGVPVATMHWWRRRLREERGHGLAPAFVEVAVGDGAPARPCGAPIVARVGAVELIVPAGADERDVARAMRAAASL